MDWNDLKQDIEKLCSMLNQYGRRQLADMVNVNDATISRYANNHGLAYNNEKWEVVVEGVREGQEERKPDIVERNGVYYISSGKRTISISKEKLRELKDLYCGDDYLTINQVCRKLNITRKDFVLIKTAFDITHDDVPYIDDDLMENPLDELIDETLEKRKEKYFLNLQEKEISSALEELKKYRKKDYFYNKVIEEVVIPARPLTFNVKRISSDTEGQLNLADWHTGLKVKNFWNKYDLDIQRDRLKTLTEKVLYYIYRHKVKCMHVMNLGDLLHGLIHVSTRVVAEVDVIEQLRIAFYLIADILEGIAREVEEVRFYSTYGNHSRLHENKADALDRENLELLIPTFLKERLKDIPNIKLMKNDYDDQILVADICGHKVFAVHGDRDKPKKVAENLTMMLEMKPYKIFTAHNHHREQIKEVHQVDVIMSRSLCGVDDYSKDIRATAKAGQSLYIYNKECLECTYDVELN